MLSRPLPEQPKEIGEAERAEIALAEQLVESGHELLAGLVGWHRREKRPEWWDFFRYKELETAELVEDGTAIGDLGGPQEVGLVKLSKVWRYPFPPQDCKVSLGKYVPDVDTHAAGRQGGGPRRSRRLDRAVDEEVARAAAAAWARQAGAGHGPGAAREHRPHRRARARRWEQPRDATHRARRAVGRGAGTPRRARRPTTSSCGWGRTLDGEVLAVQGPPGTGKTFAGSALIRELLDAGLRVGVTAQSHAVVLNLLDEVARPAWHKDGTNAEEAGEEPPRPRRPHPAHDRQRRDRARRSATGAATLVGGTAWLWSRDDMV